MKDDRMNDANITQSLQTNLLPTRKPEKLKLETKILQ